MSQGALGAPRTWKGQEGPPPGPSEGARPCWCAHCGLGESTFLLLEVAPLWTFVAAAPGRVAARAHCGVGLGDSYLGTILRKGCGPGVSHARSHQAWPESGSRGVSVCWHFGPAVGGQGVLPRPAEPPTALRRLELGWAGARPVPTAGGALRRTAPHLHRPAPAGLSGLSPRPPPTLPPSQLLGGSGAQSGIHLTGRRSAVPVRAGAELR